MLSTYNDESKIFMYLAATVYYRLKYLFIHTKETN